MWSYSAKWSKLMKIKHFDEHFLVQNQWIPFWILMDLLENCWLHQAVTFCLFGARSQPRYLKVSTRRAWSIARVKSRVARFYARIFLCWSERNFWNFSSGDVHRPTIIDHPFALRSYTISYRVREKVCDTPLIIKSWERGVPHSRCSNFLLAR